MRTFVTRVLVLALTTALMASWLVVTPSRSYACYCVPPGTPAEGMADSTAVFRATVTDLNVRTGRIISSADPVKVTFQVKTVWKGPVQGTLEATTARSSPSCGYEFAEGGEYLVYARGDVSDLQVSLCSRTTPLSHAAEDLAELGQGNVVESGPDLERDAGPLSVGCSAPTHGGLIAYELSLGAMLVGLVGLRLRRKPTS